MKNNSMAELCYTAAADSNNECYSKIVKPKDHVNNMRNSANGAAWLQTAASSRSKAFDRTNRRSDSIEHNKSTASKRLLNREDLLSGSPVQNAQILKKR